MNENWLTPDTQLSRFEKHAPNVFDYAHQRVKKSRGGIDLSAVPTTEALTEKAARIEATLEAGVNLREKDLLKQMEPDLELSPEEQEAKVFWIK